MIKMLVTDIDGTILNHKNECSKKMRASLAELKKRGIKVVLASGRMYQGIEPIAKELGIDTPIICSQGSMVKYNGEVLWQAPIEHSVARDVMKFLRRRNIHTNLYNGGNLLTENDEHMDEYCHGRFVTYEITDFDGVELTDVSKLLAIVPNENEMLQLIDDLKKRYEGVLEIVRSHKLYCEITDKEATKGNALRFVAKYFGFAKEEIMASGDQDNDYEMLKAAGVAIAMGNGSPRLKEIADYICPCIEDDGLVNAVEKFILCE